MNLYETERNGSQYRKATSKFVVSRWYVPGGCEYDRARPIDIFFDKEDDAKAYFKDYEMPPEMASIWPIAIHDEIALKNIRSYREYKRRFWSDFREEDRPAQFRNL